MKEITDHRDASFDLAGLCERANALLRGVSSDDGRTSDTVDARTVRFYQSSGLVDRPARYEGRAAIYAYRHLLQVVAVKTAQAAGHPLALIQRALAGVSTADLEAAALGEAPVAAPAPQPRPLLAYELAPGVVLTVDRDRADPKIEARIVELLTTLTGGRP